MLANICIFIGLLIIFYDEIDKLAIKGVHEAAIKEGRLTEAGSLLSLAMFFGTSVFAYEAIGVVREIYQLCQLFFSHISS